MKDRPLMRKRRGDPNKVTEGTFPGILVGGPLDGDKIRPGFWSLLAGAHLLLRKKPGKPRRVAVYKWTDTQKNGRDVWKFVRYETTDWPKTKG